ncbi:MAG: hypothetical protein ACI9U2_004099 [Bradymonadia bacterium]|jgi:hypothetical protein
MSMDEGELTRLTATDHALIGALTERLSDQKTNQWMIRGAFVLLGLGTAMFAWRAQNWAILGVSVFATGAMLWLTRSGRGIAALERDAASGQKRVRRAHIDDKYSDDDVNVLVIDGIATAVERRWFSVCARGDDVWLDSLPHSGTLLAVRKVK